jgi:four helix bundle protein
MHDTFDRMNTLQHERLDAYGIAVELDGAVVAIAHKAGRGHAWVADQAMRARVSVVLNLAEALGREGADRARALRIGRGSALEPDAALTLMLHRGACRAEERKAAKALTVRVVAKLTALRILAAPGRRRGSDHGHARIPVHQPVHVLEQAHGQGPRARPTAHGPRTNALTSVRASTSRASPACDRATFKSPVRRSNPSAGRHPHRRGDSPPA